MTRSGGDQSYIGKFRMEPGIPVVIISGPVGVGKSAVGGALGEILETAMTPHTFIDFDHLRYTYPRPMGDAWGNTLAFRNLKDVWANCAAAGSLNLIISSVVEDWSFIDDVQRAIPDSDIVTFQLSAGVSTLQSRVRKREIGSGLDWHVNRAAELAEILAADDVPCDHSLNTENRSVIEIAQEIADQVQWRLV